MHRHLRLYVRRYGAFRCTIASAALFQWGHQLVARLGSTDLCTRWKLFAPARNFPDLGPKFKAGKKVVCAALRHEEALSIPAMKQSAAGPSASDPVVLEEDVDDDWSAPWR